VCVSSSRKNRRWYSGTGREAKKEIVVDLISTVPTNLDAAVTSDPQNVNSFGTIRARCSRSAFSLVSKPLHWQCRLRRRTRRRQKVVQSGFHQIECRVKLIALVLIKTIQAQSAPGWAGWSPVRHMLASQ
jgi:hypothetical protein